MRALLILLVLLMAYPTAKADENRRLVMFVGVDVSGSFLKRPAFQDSLAFLAKYIHAHLNGIDDLDRPSHLFVGSLGGDKIDEAKTFHPIESFEGKTVEEIHKKLTEIFPQKKSNHLTDFNAFIEQVASTVRNRKLVLKPISLVFVSDGMPDIPNVKGEEAFRKIDTNPLELLSRNVTMRLLYTDAVTAKNWETKIPRKRVKVWTQDASVMKEWKDFKPPEKFSAWLKSNVDFNVASQRVE